MINQDIDHPGEQIKFAVFHILLASKLEQKARGDSSEVTLSDEDLTHFWVDLAIDEVKKQLGQNK